MKPDLQRNFVLALAQNEGPAAALDTMAEAAVTMAGASIPEVGPAHKALEAWGIPFEKGEPIQRMFSSTPALRAELPVGWTISRRGGGGHVELLDARGAARLHWHIHGWDPIALWITARFFVKIEDVSASEAVAQVVDGVTVIHTIPVRYPHPRLNDLSGGRQRFRNGWDDDGWSREMGRANYKMQEDAQEAGKAWLDQNRAGHRDPITAWNL